MRTHPSRLLTIKLHKVMMDNVIRMLIKNKMMKERSEGMKEEMPQREGRRKEKSRWKRNNKERE